jgi:ectoine hydroxylase-related dioxygenase (phytanoyl-CoA dioxygenase family)
VNVEAFSHEQFLDWEHNGFLVLKGFADATTCNAMFNTAVAISRSSANDEPIGDTEVVLETAPSPTSKHPEDRVAKITRIHHQDGIFSEFIHRPEVSNLLGHLLGDDVDCFSSNFIFKSPGALGQPWHQDAWYHRMEPSNQISAWLAVTETTIDNGTLWLLPGSHREPVHAVEPDPRPGARPGYVAITDHDMEAGIPLLLDPGDLVLFGFNTMHRSTDNLTDTPRAAMLYHFGSAGTYDPTLDPDPTAFSSHLSDIRAEAPLAAGATEDRVRNLWIPIRRAAQPI